MRATRSIPAEAFDALEQAVILLRQGGLVAFPTDTVYGLGGALEASAVAGLFEVKGRDAAKAIAVLVGAVEQVDRVASHFPPAAALLAGRYWPGALTLVVPKNEDLPPDLSPYLTVGIRMPDHPFALQLLRAVGPLAVTSANLSGQPSPTNAREVLDQLAGRIDLVIDGGECPGGVPSTVVDCSGPDARVLREGAVPGTEITALLSGNT